jgi:hypothetical protein
MRRAQVAVIAALLGAPIEAAEDERREDEENPG